MKVGITGHQDLGDATATAWVKEKMSAELDKLNIEEAFSSLAIGADQLFATLVLVRKIPLIAVIPSRNYEKTFSAGQLKNYYSFLKQVTDIIRLEFIEPSEAAFFEAGKRIADESDIIFAVWNNKPAKGLGGTADIVAYAKSSGKKMIYFNPVTQTVSNIHHP